MNFELTEEQQMVRDTARRFAETEIKPVAAKLDATHEHPAEICRKLAELGFLGIAVPEEYGGGGMDYVSYVLALIEISKACASTGVIMSVNNSLYCFPVMAFGTHEQKMKYLKPVASGEYLGCFGLTEAGAGSDPAGMRTTAVLEGDDWVLNGEKKFITNGNVSRYGVVAAVTEKGKGHKGISSFVVDFENTPGFSLGRVEEKMGINASGTAELVFDNARIPKDGLLGRPGDGFKQMLTTLDGGRVGIASQAIGIGRASLEESLEYAKTREQFGKAIATFQAIQWKLADTATRIEAARLLTYRAAFLKDQGRRTTLESAMAKLYSSEIAVRAAEDSVQIHGGYGFVKDYPAEKFFRDVKLTTIGEGTSEIQRLVIARQLLA
jgi:alkylation response protein AidB-like acyl-CoA dehydrogenase